MGLEIVEGDVLPVEHVTEETDATGVEHFAQRRDNSLDARMVGGDAVAHQSVRSRKLFEQVDRHLEVLLCLQQDVGRIDSCGTGADYGKSQFRHGFLVDLQQVSTVSTGSTTGMALRLVRALDDAFGKTGERLLHGTGWQRDQRLHGLPCPPMCLVESLLRHLVAAQLGDRAGELRLILIPG